MAAIDQSEIAQQFSDILQESCFSADEANRALAIVREAASKIDEVFEGKLQLFLRNNADLLVRRLSEQLQLSTCEAAEAEEAFGLWLQNTCSMPLSLFDRHMVRRESISPPARTPSAELWDTMRGDNWICRTGESS
jgi:hypothetical protein